MLPVIVPVRMTARPLEPVPVCLTKLFVNVAFLPNKEVPVPEFDT